tara:strand:- start:2213 stop:2434 length:222 start_codon:yes stop_codon:yes gene_type:complete
MKTYKDLNNNLWAYEEDGSQDHIIPVDFILITDEEAEAIRASQAPKYVPPPQPTKEELLAQIQLITEKINALS